MNKVVIELDEEYKVLSNAIRASRFDILGILIGNNKTINNLLSIFKLDRNLPSTRLLIARIYVADEIKFVEAKKHWRLKNEVIDFLQIDDKFTYFAFNKATNQVLATELNSDEFEVYDFTESKFKQLLFDTNCSIPFDKWEAVEV